MRGMNTRLRALRGNRGGSKSRSKPLTIRDLSERTGFSIGHLSDVEQGRKEASPKMVAALSRAFGMPLLKMQVACTRTFAEASRAERE